MRIELVAVGSRISLNTLDELAARIARELRTSCHVREDSLDAGFAFDPVRNQYHATAILRHLAGAIPAPNQQRILGVASVDLYVPIFTFVFGEAQLAGPAAVISRHRLRQEFYGQPGDIDLTRERLLKEALHELGHTFGLRHCQDWNCPMSTTTAIERLDWKSTEYCDTCREAVVRGASAA
jgi:archaemetzincin